MFVKAEDLIEIKIYYKQSGYKFLALTQKDVDTRITEKHLTKDQLKEEFKVLILHMSVLSWGAYNELQNNASVVNDNGEKYFDYKRYKEDRLKQLVRSWDAVDAEGSPVPVNPATVMSLAPTIGDAIVRAYDEATFYDEESEKK